MLREEVVIHRLGRSCISHVSIYLSSNTIDFVITIYFRSYVLQGNNLANSKYPIPLLVMTMPLLKSQNEEKMWMSSSKIHEKGGSSYYCYHTLRE